MKNFILSFGLMLVLISGVTQAHAVPVMNENAADSKDVTMFPDHADPKVFYVAPNFLTICEDAQGTPRFSFQDLAVSTGLHALVQMTLCGRYNEEPLNQAKSAVLARVPDARFVALPFVSSRIVFDNVLSPLIVTQFCDHAAGTVGDEQTCAFHLNIRGRRIFVGQVRDRVAMTMQYEYSVAGFIRNPDGSFANQLSTFGVAARIGGDSLKQHPELFVDQNGRPLKSK